MHLALVKMHFESKCEKLQNCTLFTAKLTSPYTKVVNRLTLDIIAFLKTKGRMTVQQVVLSTLEHFCGFDKYIIVTHYGMCHMKLHDSLHEFTRVYTSLVQDISICC